jgi:hypothetical protein
MPNVVAPSEVIANVCIHFLKDSQNHKKEKHYFEVEKNLKMATI